MHRTAAVSTTLETWQTCTKAGEGAASIRCCDRADSVSPILCSTAPGPSTQTLATIQREDTTALRSYASHTLQRCGRAPRCRFKTIGSVMWLLGLLLAQMPPKPEAQTIQPEQRTQHPYWITCDVVHRSATRHDQSDCHGWKERRSLCKGGDHRVSGG